jgi:hypothetical protein
MVCVKETSAPQSGTEDRGVFKQLEINGGVSTVFTHQAWLVAKK